MANNSGSIYMFECSCCDLRWEAKSSIVGMKKCPECETTLFPKKVKKSDKHERIGAIRYECLTCENTDTDKVKRKYYSEVRLRSKCNGLSVDLFCSQKYKHLKSSDKTKESESVFNVVRESEALESLPIKTPAKPFNSIKVDVDIDVSDALKGLKAVERQAKKTARALKEVETITSKLTGGH